MLNPPRGFDCRCRTNDSILGTAIDGPLKGHGLLVPAMNVLVAGFGPKLRDRISGAAWNATLLEGELYAYCRHYGVIKLRLTTMKDIEAALGDGFVRVEQGIVVALSAVLVPNVRDRLVGINVGDEVNPVIIWVSISKSGRKALEALLPHRGVAGSRITTLRDLAAAIGDWLVRVEQSIRVALRGILVRNLRELVRVNIGRDVVPVIDCISISQRGRKALETLLPHHFGNGLSSSPIKAA